MTHSLQDAVAEIARLQADNDRLRAANAALQARIGEREASLEEFRAELGACADDVDFWYLALSSLIYTLVMQGAPVSRVGGWLMQVEGDAASGFRSPIGGSERYVAQLVGLGLLNGLREIYNERKEQREGMSDGAEEKRDDEASDATCKAGSTTEPGT